MRKFLKHKKLKGFSLVEMLLTMAILVSLTTVSMTVYTGFINENRLDSTKNTVVEALTSAQANSGASIGDSQWGVHITSSNVTLFNGATYATRDTSQDFIYAFSSTVGISGPTDIVFSKVYAVPGTTGTISLTLAGRTMNIVIGTKAITSY